MTIQGATYRRVCDVVDPPVIPTACRSNDDHARLACMGTQDSRRQRTPLCVIASLCIGVGLAGCGTSASPPIAIQSPVATTLSWFQAVNDHNMPLAQEHFVAADRDMMNWSSWGPPFKDLHCRLESGTASSANVHCTFSPITDANSGLSGDSFWNVYLQREPSGRWLINNYGQG